MPIQIEATQSSACAMNPGNLCSSILTRIYETARKAAKSLSGHKSAGEVISRAETSREYKNQWSSPRIETTIVMKNSKCGAG